MRESQIGVGPVPRRPPPATRTSREFHRRADEIAKSTEKIRLDARLVELGLFDTRARAQAAILAGDVTVDGEVCAKAGHAVSRAAQISVRERSRWVSRGADKLLAAFERFGLSVADRVCLDVGAGSGGFTQVLLENGAARVYAVDVGYGQFDLKLRPDPRLVLIERKNARELTAKDIPDPVDFFTMDVSFISIFKVLPAIVPLLKPAADGVILFKPNFEARKGEIQKGGLLLDPEIHMRLLGETRTNLTALGLTLTRLTPSPLRGGDGNIEYLLSLTRRPGDPVPPETLSAAVTAAFAERL